MKTKNDTENSVLAVSKRGRIKNLKYAFDKTRSLSLGVEGFWEQLEREVLRHEKKKCCLSHRFSF
jgi:hypothetical protein